jgi:hypothetical protein
LVIEEVTIQVTFLIFVIFTTILFFKHSPLFPKMFIVQILFAVISTPALMILMAATLSIYTGQPTIQILTSAYGVEDFIPMFYNVTIGAVWIPYVLMSRRVANTFRRKPRLQKAGA